MSQKLTTRIADQLAALSILDPHSHINPHAPASTSLRDIMGYHYYTELCHAAGMPRDQIEEPGLEPKELVRRMVCDGDGRTYIDRISNTVQSSWLIHILKTFYDFDADRLTPDNWEAVYDHSAELMAEGDWASRVVQDSNIRAVFLTNDFDDPLEGFDTDLYIPCLRTDDLVFHLAKPEVQQRLAKATDTDLSDLASLDTALGQVFEAFCAKGARACAISIPPDFNPAKVEPRDAGSAFQSALQNGVEADTYLQGKLSQYVFWKIAELCEAHGLPFDLMIGVNRRVYEDGVFQGQDLFDPRYSLYQYRALFNAFPNVTFPVSVLTDGANQDLVSYAWIFPNVVTSGHWWYSNIPGFIDPNLLVRLQAVPRTKQVGYYSDAYKLEFIAPKFAMYRKCLAQSLANWFVIGQGWTEEQAVELGRELLETNPARIFGFDLD